MTRQEILELLKIMRAAYPNSKVADPEGTVKAWELAFGNEDADIVYKAARYHLDKSPYFPTIADIKKARGKGELIYGINQAGTAPRISGANMISPSISFCDYCGLCDKKDQSLCDY